jgi:hypothetical protein
MMDSAKAEDGEKTGGLDQKKSPKKRVAKGATRP